MENSTKEPGKTQKCDARTWALERHFSALVHLSLNNNVSKQFPFEAHGTRRWKLSFIFCTMKSMPRHNPPESIGCQGRHHVLHGLALHQMAVPAGEGEVRCQALVHFLVALRLHKGQQGSVLPWQGNASQYAALILRSGWHWRCKYWQKGHDGESPWERKLLFAFCCAMLTQAPCLSLVQQGHLLSNESAQRLWHQHPEVGVSGLTSVVLLWRLILRSSTKSARRRRHWYPGPRWSHRRISGPNRTKTSVDFLVSPHQHNVDC